MASVWKHTTGKNHHWIARYKDENGKWRNQATPFEAKENLRKRALECAQGMEDTARMAKRGEALQKHIEEGARRIVERTLGANYKRKTCREYFEEWVEDRKSDTAPRTVVSYEGTVDDFLAHLGKQADEPLAFLQVEHLKGFQALMESDGLSLSTVRQRLKVIGSALKKAVNHDLIPSNPFKRLTMPRGKAESREPFTLPEVRRLIANAQGDWKTVILFGVGIGARLGDAISMRWEGVNLFAGTITFEPDKQRRGMEEKETKALHADILDHLKRLHAEQGGKPSGLITPSLHGRKSGGSNGLAVEFKEIMRAASIKAGEKKRASGWTTSSKSFHSLRHSFVTIGAGINARAAQSISGHKSDEVFKHYDHLTLADQRNLVSAMPSLVTGEAS